MTPVELRDKMRDERRDDEADIVERMIYALKIASDNLYVSGLDALRDMSPRQCMIIAEMCHAATWGEPHNELDDAIKKAEGR